MWKSTIKILMKYIDQNAIKYLTYLILNKRKLDNKQAQSPPTHTHPKNKWHLKTNCVCLASSFVKAHLLNGRQNMSRLYLGTMTSLRSTYTHSCLSIKSALRGCTFHNTYEYTSVPGKFLGIVGQDPSDSKSNRLHVDIFWFCLLIWGLIL